MLAINAIKSVEVAKILLDAGVELRVDVHAKDDLAKHRCTVPSRIENGHLGDQRIG